MMNRRRVMSYGLATGVLAAGFARADALHGNGALAIPRITDSLAERTINFWATDTRPQRADAFNADYELRKWSLSLPDAYISAIVGENSPKAGADHPEGGLLVAIAFLEADLSPLYYHIAKGEKLNLYNSGTIELFLSNKISYSRPAKCLTPRVYSGDRGSPNLRAASVWAHQGWIYQFSFDAKRSDSVPDILAKIDEFLIRYTRQIEVPWARRDDVNECK